MQSRESRAQRVTLVGMACDILLGLLKIVAGNLTHSHALTADGIHSLSDAITDIFVLISTHLSQRKPDDNHPYGHARIETMGTLLLGSSLIAVAILLAYNYLQLTFQEPVSIYPGWPALAIIVLSIFVKEWLFRYTKKAGETLKSNLLIANAWHSRSDAFSSIIVLVGVIGGILGFTQLDTIAAFVVALIIFKIGWQLVWNSSKELVDTGVSDEQNQRYTKTLLSVEGVLDVHALRTRHMGQTILLDVHLEVDKRISVSEGHQIGDWAAHTLLVNHPDINDVVYHIDIENDHGNEMAKSQQKSLLPLRSVVLKTLRENWQEMPNFEQITLHYLNEHIDIDIVLKMSSDKFSCRDIEAKIISRNQKTPWLGSVSVLLKQNNEA